MQRRQFLVLTAGLVALPVAGGAAYRAEPYKPGLLGDLADTRDTKILNFNASWSLTCRIKREILSDLKAANPAYAAHIGFVDVDWDTYGPSQMAQRLKVERRSTLIALRGREEVGRLVAETDPARIEAFLDDVLAAARAA